MCYKDSMLKHCPTHPKYTGKHKPKNNCTSCLELYLILHQKPRTPIMPSKIFQDKSKYNRKKKHIGGNSNG